MIVSSSILKTSLERYRELRMKEGYSTSSVAGAGASAAFTSFSLVVAVIFFILELILLFYGVGMALQCTAPGAERIVNIVLLVVFTIPYVLLNTLFNQCAKNSLRTNYWTRKA